MKNINWKVRARSPQFWVGLIGVILSPILAYLGIGFEDLTTWDSVKRVSAVFGNPYLILTVAMAILSFIGVRIDPTTKGLGTVSRHKGMRSRKMVLIGAEMVSSRDRRDTLMQRARNRDAKKSSR